MGCSYNRLDTPHGTRYVRISFLKNEEINLTVIPTTNGISGSLRGYKSDSTENIRAAGEAVGSVAAEIIKKSMSVP